MCFLFTNTIGDGYFKSAVLFLSTSGPRRCCTVGQRCLSPGHLANIVLFLRTVTHIKVILSYLIFMVYFVFTCIVLIIFHQLLHVKPLLLLMMTSECPSVNALALTHPIQLGSRLSFQCQVSPHYTSISEIPFW